MLVTGKTQECNSEMQPIRKKQTDDTNEILSEIFKYKTKKFIRICQKKKLFPLVTQAICFKREYFDKYGFKSLLAQWC